MDNWLSVTFWAKSSRIWKRSIQQLRRSTFSDGASSQFKQKYMFTNLTLRSSKRSVMFKYHMAKEQLVELGVMWSGVSGWQISLEIMHQMQSLARIAVKHRKKTEVQLVLASEIMEGTAALEDRWLNILSLPKTHMIHCVIHVCRYVVKCSTYSSTEHFNTISLHANCDIVSDTAGQPVIKHDSAWIGDFIIVEMCGQKTMKSFVAQVVDSSDDCVELSFLRQADLDKSGRVCFPCECRQVMDQPRSCACPFSTILWQSEQLHLQWESALNPCLECWNGYELFYF